jgi:hypothetical protein
MQLHPLAVSLCGCCPQRDADRQSTVNLRTPTVTGDACHRPSSVVRCRPWNPRTISALCPVTGGACRRPSTVVRCRPSNPRTISALCPVTGGACRRPSTVVRCRPSNPRTISVLRTCNFTRVRAPPSALSLAVPAVGHPPWWDAAHRFHGQSPHSARHWQCLPAVTIHREMPTGHPRSISVLRTCHFTRVRAPLSALSPAVLAVGHPPW